MFEARLNPQEVWAGRREEKNVITLVLCSQRPWLCDRLDKKHDAEIP
jgi:hypothetical protein